jgi:ribosome-associated protein
MIVASGTSNRHTSFLAEKLVQQIKETTPDYIPSAEGVADGNWALVDAGNVIVHIFKPGVRELYNLESMWSVPITEAELTTA